MASIDTLIDQWASIGPIAWAENDYGWREGNNPITLAKWQKLVLAEYWQRQEDISTLFVSCPKKAGKTFLNSLLTCYRWLTMPGVHFALGNDWEQGSLLQGAMIAGMVKAHPILKKYVKVNKNELLFRPTDSQLITLAADYAGSSGHNFLTVSFTETWAFTHEGHVRLFEEMTPPPLTNALRIVDSYAGYEGESTLLENVWKRGESGEKIGDDLYLTGQQLSFIATGEQAQVKCWRGTDIQREAYYTEQRETLRPGTYDRLHLNQWAASEDIFISADSWDSLIQPGYACPIADKSIRLFLGVDAAVKHDHAAAVSVYHKDNLLHLGPYRIWKPSPQIDLEVIENYILELAEKFTLSLAICDPYQLQHLIQRLKKRGIRISEYPQTVANMTIAGNTLLDLIRQNQLVAYPTKELRQHILNAHAKETPRGIRLIKGTSSRKIDAAISLAMACVVGNENKFGGFWCGSWNGELSENTEWLGGDGTYIGRRNKGVMVEKVNQDGSIERYPLRSEEEINPQPKQVRRKKRRRGKPMPPGISNFEF